MLYLLSLALDQLMLASDTTFGLPVWLPVLVFLILIFLILWLTNSFQEDKPEYLPPWAILPAIETAPSIVEPSHADHDPDGNPNNPSNAVAGGDPHSERH